MSTLPKVRVKTKGTRVEVKTGSLPRAKTATLTLRNRSKVVVPEQQTKVHKLKYSGTLYDSFANFVNVLKRFTRIIVYITDSNAIIYPASENTNIFAQVVARMTNDPAIDYF